MEILETIIVRHSVNHRLSLNSQNKSLNPPSNNSQNQNTSSSESEPLSNTSSRQSSLKNSKTESKKDAIIIGDSMLNSINEEGLSDDRYNVKVKNHSGATTEDICDYIKPEVRKKPDIIIVHAGTNDITSSTKSFENYKNITDNINPKLPNCKYARNFQCHHDKRQTRHRKEGYRVQQQALKIFQLIYNKYHRKRKSRWELSQF